MDVILVQTIVMENILFFLNPDTIADEKAIEELLNAAKSNPEFGIISCNQKKYIR